MAISKRFVVAPLDWGLGHATRCIPVIRALLDCRQEVLLASSGDALYLLKAEFPDLPFAELPGYNLTYPVKGSLAAALIRQAPRLLKTIRSEHRQLKKILSEYKPDAVISDNRFGLWNKSIPTVFITHQLHIRAPRNLKWTGPAVNLMNRYFISQFNECWVPDYASGAGLAGELSHPKINGVHTTYLGPLSRFNKAAPAEVAPEYDLLFILSGPEPQRSKFEEIVLDQLKHSDKKTLVVRGKPGKNDRAGSGQQIKVVSHLDASGLRDAIQSSGLVISRPGYSSIMDYVALGKNAVLVPTPGQTEQEYLAGRFKKQKIFYSVDQKDFILAEALQACREYSIKNLFPEQKNELALHIENWLQRISSY